MSAATFHRTASFARASVRWLLAVACALALALAGAAAQPRDAWAGNSYDNCGENLKTEMGGDPLQLYIEKVDKSGSGDMYSWDGSSGHTLTNRPWYGSRAEMDTVYIGTGVSNIGTNASNGCSSLKTVYIPGIESASPGENVCPGGKCLCESTSPGESARANQLPQGKAFVETVHAHAFDWA